MSLPTIWISSTLKYSLQFTINVFTYNIYNVQYTINVSSTIYNKCFDLQNTINILT